MLVHQVGNWESWHVGKNGKERRWTVGGRKVTTEQLLNRTVLYKVGHHGSHNATLREKGLEMMTDPRLAAMVPVDEYIAHEKKHWTRMPFAPLMHRLRELAKAGVLQADEKAHMKRAKDSPQTIEVVQSGGGTAERPLYVEYELPGS